MDLSMDLCTCKMSDFGSKNREDERCINNNNKNNNNNIIWVMLLSCL